MNAASIFNWSRSSRSSRFSSRRGWAGWEPVYARRVVSHPHGICASGRCTSDKLKHGETVFVHGPNLRRARKPRLAERAPIGRSAHARAPASGVLGAGSACLLDVPRDGGCPGGCISVGRSMGERIGERG